MKKSFLSWLTLSRPTLFTEDAGFFKSNLCHVKYGLVFLDGKRDESAIFIRRLLRQPECNTQAKRSGKVVRVSYAGLFCGDCKRRRKYFTTGNKAWLHWHESIKRKNPKAHQPWWKQFSPSLPACFTRIFDPS
jgi:hypothetical protein